MDTYGLTTWDQYQSRKKRKLKKYILENEQHWLCCYCEKKITLDFNSSHVEHIKPKSSDPINLTFNYNNLLVSCEGNHYNEIGDNRKNTCGQFKLQNFDENLFLNPTVVANIHEYFLFDFEGIISPSDFDKPKAKYTCDILNLNGANNKLAEARKISRKALIKSFGKLPPSDYKKKLNLILAKDDIEFITFLRYVFRNYR